VGPILRREAGKFPQWFRGRIPELARISRRLRRGREPSMCGDEESGYLQASSTVRRMLRRPTDGLWRSFRRFPGSLRSCRGST
jgi:hypothetical protein